LLAGLFLGGEDHVPGRHTGRVPEIFDVAQARALMPAVHRQADEIITVRADLTELRAALSRGQNCALGGIPEAKALEARLHEGLAWFTTQGVVLKGFAPLLVDFPAHRGGDDVLLCWLEGERELGWYHRVDLGFAGRRPL